MTDFSVEWLFETSLKLEEPWYIEKVDFARQQELHIHIGFHNDYKFKINDDVEGTVAHDTLKKVWKNPSFFQYTAYIICNVPRVKHGEEITMIDVPWTRQDMGFKPL